MKTTLKVIACLLMLYALGVSCSNNRVQPINPNGDSELALLMRDMYDEAHQIKKQIANGEPVSLDLTYEKILTAHATEPEKASSEEYRAFAQEYLQTMRILQSAGSAEGETIFANMVDNCMTCHKAMCPGPIVKIEKLQ